ncbi:MAG: dynamin family protein [Epsilonproteobacteria bacterium]|nr:dynamin family protein [Campylobacterota bacterium]NPA56211.1 dynamin family protein [Campylobacterota bacterium]
MKPQERYKKLKEHLLEENPILVEAIDEYRTLDSVAHNLALLDRNKTFTESISWWPLISILGTFSAGKSSFINEYLGQRVQDTGNQAVDDKFTVICYSKKDEVTTLPGVALDADPRFPFYNISKEIEKIDKSDRNINRYLQLKTVHSDNLKGKILIDSPGFDADVQRDATLRITSHIIDLSDLILIFFDARHPEPGAMRDTLNHLVEVAKSHTDSDKVLYILNQIDTCAKEDNLEEIIGAWQRALSQKGIVSGKFYAIYNESLAKFEDESMEERLKKKRDQDFAAIKEKMEKVRIDRAYRIVKNIETRAKEILDKLPRLEELLEQFRSRVLMVDLILLILFIALLLFLSQQLSYDLFPPVAGVVALLFIVIHFKVKRLISKQMAKKIGEEDIRRSFKYFTRWYRSALLAPGRVRNSHIVQTLENLIEKSRNYIQKLNDQFIQLNSQRDGAPES